MNNLLITGFTPFDGHSVNPAWEAVRALPDTVGPWTLHKLLVPTVFSGAATAAIEAVRQIHPQVVVCVGQAGGRSAVTPERIAINVNDASIPDNRGFQPQDRPIDPHGPAAYFTTLPNKEIIRAISSAGIPAAISNTAGTYVCNDLIYRLLREAASSDFPFRAGFIHVPFLPEQGTPSLPLTQITQALSAALAVISPEAPKL